jgi:uncharacterized protein YkwD
VSCLVDRETRIVGGPADRRTREGECLTLTTYRCNRLFSRPAYVLVAVIAIVLIAVLGWATPAGADSAQDIELLNLVNDYRASLGLTPLMISDQLRDAARKHSSDMGKYGFTGHSTVRSDWFKAGATPWDRMAACGYGYNACKGENVAAGYTTAAAVFAAWKGSASHDKNMRDPNFRVAGVSLVCVPGSKFTYYWTLDMGSCIDPTAKWVGKYGSVAGFSDVSCNHQCAGAIALLSERGIIKGMGDGRFCPDQPVARQQFAKMVVLTLGLPVGGIQACSFGDVTRQQVDATDPLYPAAYVAVCAAKNIAVGDQSGRFQPLNNMTRAQLVTMVARAVGVPDCAPNRATPFPQFDDGTHYRWAQRAYAAGLLKGLPGVESKGYDFWKNATRAEVCVLLANVIGR